MNRRAIGGGVATQEEHMAKRPTTKTTTRKSETTKTKTEAAKKPASRSRKTVRAQTSAPKRATRQATAAEPTLDAIAVRAYELFEARGYAHGHDVEDWLRAEAELRG
jgi:uncharacterized protein HemX